MEHFLQAFREAKSTSIENKALSGTSLLLGFLGALFISWEPQKTISHIIPSMANQAENMFYFLFFACAVSIIGTTLFYAKTRSYSTILSKILIAFLPFSLAIAVGIGKVSYIPWGLHLFVGLYALLCGMAALLYLHRKETSRQIPLQPHHLIKKWHWVILIMLMGTQFMLGFSQLGKQSLVDEPLWLYGRIQRYWENLAQLNWKGTKVNDKPGITVAVISGPALLAKNPDQFETVASPQKEFFYRDMRLPIFLFSVLMTPVWFLILRRLLGTETALVGTVAVALHPLLFGISRMINPDALFWIFAPLSIFSYLSFLQSQRRSELYATGVLLGLALLTKYVANVLFVFFLLMILLAIVTRKWKTPSDWKQFLQKNLIDYGVIIFLALGIFYLFLPATWVNPSLLLESTLLSEAFRSTWPYFVFLLSLISIDTFVLKNTLIAPVVEIPRRYRSFLPRLLLFAFLVFSALAIVNVIAGMKWADFEAIVASPKSARGFASLPAFFLSNFYSLIFGISPLLLAFSTIIIIVSLYLKQHRFITTALVSFILLYYAGTTVTSVGATVRYQIMLFPLIIVLASMGSTWFWNRFAPKQFAFALGIGVFAFSSVFILWQASPFYFSYSSSLLPSQFLLNPKDMGDGSFQAAQYLNSLPHPEQNSVWTDKDGVCATFLGKCASSLDFKRYINENAHFDYYVVSKGREVRTTRTILQKLRYNPDYLIRFDKLYTFDKPEKTINTSPRGNDFIKIINAKDIDISHHPDPNKPQM